MAESAKTESALFSKVDNANCEVNGLAMEEGRKVGERPDMMFILERERVMEMRT